MKNSILLSIAILCSITLFAQNPLQRLEVEAKFESENYTIIPTGKSGLLMTTKTKSSSLSNKSTWQLTHYDTAFNLTWEQELRLSSFAELAGYDTDGKYVYLLFHRYFSNVYHFYQIDASQKKFNHMALQSLDKITVKDMKVLNGYAFVVGTSKRTPVVMHFPMETPSPTAKISVLSSSTTKKSEFEFLDKDTTNQLINFTYTTWKGNACSLSILSYDPNGELLSHINLPAQDGKNLLSGKQSITEEGNAIIIGTYANGSSRYSDGLYIAELDGKKTKFIKYHNFADLENFFNYLPEKRKEKIAKKKDKKEERQKTLDLQYRLLVHQLVAKNDQYVLVAEAYYPTYRYESSRFSGGFYRPNTNLYGGSQRVFDGFQYTHAFLAGFSKSGDLLWDNSFALDQVKYYKLKEVVKTYWEQDKVKLLYAYKGKLLSKTIKGGMVEEGEQEETIKSKLTADRIKRNTGTDVAHWYGNYFITWGFQRIKNTTSEDVKNKRNVFFFNKVPLK